VLYWPRYEHVPSVAGFCLATPRDYVLEKDLSELLYVIETMTGAVCLDLG
jgi:hypothetical protein